MSETRKGKPTLRDIVLAENAAAEALKKVEDNPAGTGLDINVKHEIEGRFNMTIDEIIALSTIRTKLQPAESTQEPPSQSSS